MSFKIPRRGKAGVAFAGVELADAWILLASIPLAIIVGGFFGGGTKAFIGIPVVGFFLNRTLLEWQSHQMPGALREWMFSHGIAGYSGKLDSQQTIFTGDNTILIPGRRPEHLVQALKESSCGNEH